MNIFNLPILEIAVSIVVAWALFAIFCSLIQEAIVQIKSERGRFLKKQLLRQLFDKPNEINWASILYTHSSVDLLSRAYNKPTSEISPTLFSEALIETVANAHVVQSLMKDGITDSRAEKYKDLLLRNFAFAVNTLKPSDVISLLKSSLMKAELKSGKENESEIYKQLNAEVSDWYSKLCERTSLWYKKKTKKRLFIIGLLISIALNIDSIQLFQYFRDEPKARTELITFYQTNQSYLENLSTQKDSIPLEELKKTGIDFTKTADSLIRITSMPVGFSYLKATACETELIFLKILGFIITAFAASMGAPYWFEVLKKATPKK